MGQFKKAPAGAFLGLLPIIPLTPPDKPIKIEKRPKKTFYVII
jgi:hypothetical protein